MEENIAILMADLSGLYCTYGNAWVCFGCRSNRQVR
jgi:hypothetical protein